MDKSEFMELLFELLNDYGEEKLGLVDIITHDKDKFVIVEPDDHKFEISVKQLQ